ARAGRAGAAAGERRRRALRRSHVVPGPPGLDVCPGHASRAAWEIVPGEGHYSAANPPFGAVFTYYLADEIKTKQATRRAAEKEAVEKKADAALPTWDSLRAEDREEAPAIVLTIV